MAQQLLFWIQRVQDPFQLIGRPTSHTDSGEKEKRNPTSGDRVGLRGRGFLGGLSLWGVEGDLAGPAGGLAAGRGGRTTLRSRAPPRGDWAGLRGRTMLTGWVPLGEGPGLRGSTSLLV
ncbi:hypothetical protein EYF80_052460 [Liparis tanakae]|uniref:Uncharacterized protein n=1 Tax=Liparis tanakae TaxID=230148 RepID=A0A4Z2FAJ9_9TELE|nr:hypothetical protein EYF80_052460 [Liparis tanakae]